MIIGHGHYTTAPRALEDWRNAQVAGLKDPSRTPKTSDLKIGDDELRESGGGAVPYHWGRFRGLAQELKRPSLKEHLLNNIYFDTCVYHQPGIDLLTRVIPADNVLFASEMIGAVRGIDPETGFNYDDTRRYIDATPNLSPQDRRKVYEGNARRVFPRLDASLKARGV